MRHVYSQGRKNRITAGKHPKTGRESQPSHCLSTEKSKLELSTVSDEIRIQMFKLIAYILNFGHVLAERFARATEWVEGFLQFAFDVLSHPGQWFRREQRMSEGDQDEEVEFDRGVDFFESLFAGILGAAFWVLRLPWQLFRRIGQADGRDGAQEDDVNIRSSTLESHAEELLAAVAGLLLAPTRWYHQRRDRERQQSEKPTGLWSLALWHLMRTGFVVVHSSVEVFDFACRWWFSRDFRKLIWATPALLMAIPLVVSVGLSPLYSTDSRIQHYRLALESATDEDDSATEALCLAKLNQLGYQRLARAEFKTASALAIKGAYQDAYEVMKKISPRTEPGYLNGHLWIAEALLLGKITEDQLWETIEIHTRHAASINRNLPFVKRLQGELHLHHGRVEQAIEAFEDVAVSFPRYYATLMHADRERGDMNSAKLCAKRAVRFFHGDQGKFEGKEITALGYLLWAEAHELLGHQTARFQVLQRGVSQFPNDTALQLAFDHAVDDRLAGLTLNDSTAPQLLEEIIQASPRNPQVWQMLLRGVNAENQESHQIIALLRSKELLPADFFKRVGDVYFTKTDYSTAREYYELTCEMEPDSAFAWNNLGWILGNVEPLQMQSALVALNKAIACLPDPRFFETRGQILVKQQRWMEAIDDLQRAINGHVPNMADAHRSLATAYDQLGNPEQAAAHRSILRRSGS